MCWCARVYWTVLHNLFARFYNSLTERGYRQGCCACCCGGYSRQAGDDDGDVDVDADADSDAGKRVLESIVDDDQQRSAAHDYVIVGKFWASALIMKSSYLRYAEESIPLRT